MNTTRLLRFLMLGCAAVFAGALIAADERIEGYKNTPMIPGTRWHVHDGDRPQPPVVTPGRKFSQTADAPSDAVVLFDGKDLARWEGGNGRPAAWKVENGAMVATPKGGNIRTRQRFPDFQLHLEFATPTPAVGTSQGRGNSGVLINNEYEVQVLDSYRAKTYPDGQCGALYGQSPPLVNACRPPGEWQTYDITFESPRWDKDGKLVKKATVTVIQNGVVIHNHREFIGHTDGIGGVPWRSLGKYGRPEPPEAFIELQYHGHPVRYRNVWIRALGEYDRG
jgi:hypothetical protein